MSEESDNSQNSLVETFVQESTELLEEATNLILELNSVDNRLKSINGLFRNFHSVKGNSAMFGLEHVKRLAHDLESLLGELRQSPDSVNSEMVSLLMDCRDHLAETFKDEVAERLSDGSIAVTDSLCVRLTAMIDSVSGGVGFTVKRLLGQLSDMLGDEASDARNIVNELQQVLAESESEDSSVEPSDAGPRTPWPRPYRELIKLAQYAADEPLDAEQRNAIGVFLDQLSDMAKESETTEMIRDLQERIVVLLDIEDGDALIGEILEESLESLQEHDFWSEETESVSGDAARPVDVSQARTMRVPESEIDQFLSYVGELIVVSDMFRNIQEQMGSGTELDRLVQSFRVANDTFVSLSDSLQKSIMSLRRVQVDTLFQKAPRIIYGIQSDSGCEVDLSMEGTSLFIDKSLLEALDAPFTHLVRNAADHGIESKEKRIENGKPPAGRIRLSAREEAAQISILVEDDGNGLNTESIRQKAESMELIPYGKELSDDEIHDLIFHPGLSTAAKVTSVSGRGVGLDSVRTEVEGMGGVVKVESREGEGTCFTLTMPRAITTRIISGFLVEVGEFLIIIPMRQVVDAFSFEDGDLVSVVGKEHCIVRNEEVLPMHDLGRLLGMPGRQGKVSPDSVLVQVQMPNNKMALQVDRVVGVQKVVLRDIRGVDDIDFISGGALMGDGSVAFVLDLKTLESTMGE